MWASQGTVPSMQQPNGCWGKASADYLQRWPVWWHAGGSVCAWGQQHMALVVFFLPPCPTPHLPTLQAAFAHLALAFRCDMFTLQQRVQVEKRARDAAEENIQEELGQCRAALEVGGHKGKGLAPAGVIQPQRGLDAPSASSSSSILSPRRGWANPAPMQAARRRCSSCSTA